LILGRQMTVARCTVGLVMRRLALAGLPGRPKYRKIPNTPIAEDLVNRDFARTEPNRLWLTDITEHRTREGKVYCAVVLDAFSRRVVGWSIDSSQTSNLVVNALGMAIENRQAEGVVIHSDHGTQYTSWAFTRRLARLRARAVDGIDRGLLRQRPDGIVLGAHAGRAAQPQALEHTPRVGQRDLRVP
jgi:transposase InsO family protein